MSFLANELVIYWRYTRNLSHHLLITKSIGTDLVK